LFIKILINAFQNTMDARGNYQFKPRLILAQLKKNTNHPTNTNVFYIYTRIHKAPTESHPQYRT